MTFTDVMYAMGDGATASFGAIEALGNIPNYTILVGGFVGLVIWLRMQGKFSKESEQNGTLE